MGAFRAKTAEGMFVELEPMGLASVAAIAAIRKERLPALEGKDREAAERALEAIEALPVIQANIRYGPMDAGYDADLARRDAADAAKGKSTWSSRHNAGLAPCHGWMAPSGPKAASAIEGVACGSPEEAGWLAVGGVVKHRWILGSLLHAVQAPGLDERKLKGAMAAGKRAEAVFFEPVDEQGEMASCEAWALFVKKGHGDKAQSGFFDAKGNVGPLSRARMFESAKAAAKTAMAHGFSAWKVAKASVGLVALESFPGDSSENDKLAGAMALRDAAALDKALEEAGMERLREKIRQLSEQEALSMEPAAPRGPKNRL
jgi:hypothetical protein